MKRFLRSTTLLAASILALGACAKGDTAAAGDSSAAGAPFRMALLTPGPISDQSWNRSAYAGLMAVKDSMGASVSHIQTKTPADFEENFRQYGSQGYDMVVGHGFEFQDAATRVAPSYPKTVYIVTSGRVSGPNIAGVAFAFEEASYQAGMVAGALTKTGTIGLIAGQDLPPVKASFDAFTLGAKSTNPNIKVLTSYIGNWEDVNAGKEQALTQIGRGADIIFQNADAAGLGVFQAAREKGVLTFGTNSNQNDVAPDVIIGSVVIDQAKAFLLIARQIRDKKFDGKVFFLGAKEDIVRLTMNPALQSRVPAAIMARVDSVGAALRAGTFRALDDIVMKTDSTTQPKPTPAP